MSHHVRETPRIHLLQRAILLTFCSLRFISNTSSSRAEFSRSIQSHTEVLCTVSSHVGTSRTLKSQSEMLLHWTRDFRISQLCGRATSVATVARQDGWGTDVTDTCASPCLHILGKETESDEWHFSSGPAAKEVSQPLEGIANSRSQLLSPGRLVPPLLVSIRCSDVAVAGHRGGR